MILIMYIIPKDVMNNVVDPKIAAKYIVCDGEYYSIFI